MSVNKRVHCIVLRNKKLGFFYLRFSLLLFGILTKTVFRSTIYRGSGYTLLKCQLLYMFWGLNLELKCFFINGGNRTCYHFGHVICLYLLTRNCFQKKQHDQFEDTINKLHMSNIPNVSFNFITSQEVKNGEKITTVKTLCENYKSLCKYEKHLLMGSGTSENSIFWQRDWNIFGRKL